MSGLGPPGGEATFTDEEYDALFVDVEPLAPAGRRRLPRLVSLLGLFVAATMLAVYVGDLVGGVASTPTIREPAEIRAVALDEIAESPWGWLATEVRIESLPEPRVGAYVTNNPPDGVITIDLRPWTAAGLDELIDHELGHLLDFAVWGTVADGRRGGIGTEAWAECAAVAAGTRALDRRDPGTEYHCYADEFAVYEAAVAELTEVCRNWGSRECRPVTPG